MRKRLRIAFWCVLLGTPAVLKVADFLSTRPAAQGVGIRLVTVNVDTRPLQVAEALQPVIMNPRQITVDFMVAEGDLVTVRSTMRATQSGQYHDMPPSGKEVTISYINVYRIRNHRIVENWVAVDRLSLMEQLGRKLCPPEAP